MARNSIVKREHHIPTDYAVIKQVEEHGVLVVADSSRMIVMGFSGKAQKPNFYLRFRTVERAEEYVADWFARIERRAEEKRAAREARKNESHSLEVGTVLYSSWGYDQTNIDYYEVVKVVGKSTVEIREIARISKETESMQGSCIPAPGQFIGPVMRRRVNSYGSVKITSFYNASPAKFTMVAGCKIYNANHWTAYA